MLTPSHHTTPHHLLSPPPLAIPLLLPDPLSLTLQQAQADKDGDGVITFDEFVIVSKKFPNILFPAYQTK